MLKKRNLLFLSLLILGALLLSSCFLNPPVTEGILKGQVMVPEGTLQAKDLTGQSLPGATVNIIDLSTGAIIATATTDATGHYQVSVPPGGPYLLEAVKGSVKLEQITCQVEVGIEYDLGTADCVTTAAALIAEAMIYAGDNPADIDCADIIADPDFDDVSSIVCSTIQAGGDPTVSALVQQAVEDFLNPPTPTPSPPAAVHVSAVTVTPTTMTLTAGGVTETLVATVLPAGAANKTVTWASDNAAASVDDSGVVTGISGGTAIITVTTVDGNFTANCTVNVITPGEYFTFDIPTGTITDYNKAGGLDVVIPSMIDNVEVEHIDDNAFEKKSLTSVTIPDGVTSIGEYAFYDNLLTSVTIPDGVTSIGEAAFAVNDLTSVTIPDSVKTIGNSAFMDNDLTSVIIPDSVESIGDYAFRDNHLISVSIGNGVTSIGESAFNINRLTSVIIPDGVTSISKNAFSNNQLTSVTLPDGVTSIGDSAFRYNDLTSVSIGDNVAIDSNITTMGTNTGFKDVYNVSKEAGTYNYEDTGGGVWEWVKK